MNKLSATELALLISETQKLLGLYYQKDKWKSIFPTISYLAEKYDHFFESNPNAMQAQLSFYLEKQGYTTNLVINQIIIVLSICQSLGINHVIRQQLIAVCLCQYICIQKESNAIAANLKISPQGIKLYKMRYALALKLMNYAQVPDSVIQNIFHNLTLYKQVISGNKHNSLTNINTIIISISTLLSKEITLAKNHKAKSLTKAIAELYQKSSQLTVQNILKTLISHLPAILPGTKISSSPDCYYIGQFDKKDKLVDLCFKIPQETDSSKGSFSLSKPLLNQNQAQHICTDQRVIFKIWFAPLEAITSKNELQFKNSHNTKKPLENIDILINNLNSKKHHSIEELCDLLHLYPNIAQALCQLSSKANRTKQNIASIRHAIMMLGAIRTPLLIQKIILELQLDELGDTNWLKLKPRVHALTVAAELAAQEIYDFLPEEASICILKYCYILLAEKNNQIHHISISKTNLDHGSLFLIETLLDIKNTKESSAHKIQNSIPKEWLTALVCLHRKNSKEAIKKPSNQLYCLGISLLLINKIYKPGCDLNAYENEFISQAIKNLKLESLDEFLNSLLELNFYNRITLS